MALKDKEKQKKADVKIQQLHREEEEQKAKNLATELGFPYLDLRISTIDDDALTIFNEKDPKCQGSNYPKKAKRTLYCCF